jgi:outer membrane lipoprotein-sorting protein
MRALLSFLVLLPLVSQSQTADDVVQQYLRFTGGEKNWKKVHTMVTKGEYDYGGIVFPFTTYAKAPDRYKFVVPFNGKYYAQGYDGKSGWKIDAFKNETTPTILEGTSALAMANEADVELENPFVDYKAKGHQIKLEGRDTIENKVCYKLNLLKKNEQIETYYFDVDTYTLHLKIATAKNIELGGALLHTYFYEYTEIDGLKLPLKHVSKAGDQTILTVTVKKVIFNTEIKEDEFKPITN